MKTKRMMWKSFAAFIMAALVLTSCLNDPEPAALDALPDVFVQKTVQEGVEKYGIAFWVLGNKELESVEVEGPDDETWSLEGDGASNRVFSLFPEDEDYTETMPEAGDYKFVITSTQEGEAPLTVTDKLGEQVLGTLVIDTTEYANSKLKVTWETLNNADGYFIRLYDDTNKRIFGSGKIAKDKTEFSFGNTDEGWLDSSTKAEVGKTYQLDVLAIRYESGSTAANQDYNVQFISIASTELVWGE